jgi:hypothetical protein
MPSASNLDSAKAGRELGLEHHWEFRSAKHKSEPINKYTWPTVTKPALAIAARKVQGPQI